MGSARIHNSGGAIHTVARWNAKSPIRNRRPLITDATKSGRQPRPTEIVVAGRTRAAAHARLHRCHAPNPGGRTFPMRQCELRCPQNDPIRDSNKHTNNKQTRTLPSQRWASARVRRKKKVSCGPSLPPPQSTVLSTAPIAIVPQIRRLRSFVSSGWPLAFVAPPDDLA